MEGVYGDKYSFVGEWYDNNASLTRRFLVFYFPFDDSIEMFELKTRKTFVRRNKVQGVKLDNFYIGCSVTILGRIIKIVDFACEDTRKKLAKSMEVTFCMIKPVSTADAGEIVSELYERGYKITRMKKARVTTEDINKIFKEERTQASFPFTVEYLTGQYVIGVELVGTDAVSALQAALGAEDPTKAAPGTIRARFGTDLVRNCAYASLSRERAMDDLEYFFPPPLQKSLRLRLTPALSNCTLCLVKPHAVREKQLGNIMRAIDEANFNITALNMYNMEIVNAAEFYEVYKGIVTEYKAMVDELSSGPCVAMEIVSKKEDIYTAVEFRKLVGPADPEIAKLLRPHTLRAKFGNTKVQNAVHCSDLAEDGLLEVEYFFKILDL